MSQVLEQARQIKATDARLAAEEKQKARDYVVQIAARELLGKSTGRDAEDLVEALGDAEMTEDDYRDILEAIPRSTELEARQRHLIEAAAGIADARKNLAKVQGECELMLDNAQRQVRRCDNSSQLYNVNDSRRNLRTRFPFLFDAAGDPLNLLPGRIEQEHESLRATHQETMARHEQHLVDRIEGRLQRKGFIPSPVAPVVEAVVETVVETARKLVSKPKATKGHGLPSVDD